IARRYCCKHRMYRLLRSRPVELRHGAVFFQQIGERHCQAMVSILFETPDHLFTCLSSMDSLDNSYWQRSRGTEQGIYPQLTAMLCSSPSDEYPAIRKNAGSFDKRSAPAKLRKSLAQIACDEIENSRRFLSNAE